MFVEERHSVILGLVNEKGRVTIDELCNELGISKPTVRRDLTVMENDGLIKRTHGGAMPRKDMPGSFNYNITESSKKNRREKSLIAQKAADLVSEGDIIALGSGSTIVALASVLRSKKNITIVTNSIAVATELSGSVSLTVLIIGGKIDSSTLAINGPLAIRDVNFFKFKRCFLGAVGIDPERGSTDLHLDEIEVKRAFSEAASETVLLMDNSKFKSSSLALSLPILNIDTFITDKDPGAKAKASFAKNNVNLLVAE